MTSVITLSGWAQPHDALNVIAPEATHIEYGSCKDVEQAMERISAQGSRTDIAVGWSLGGSLLMEAVHRKLICPKRLILLAAPVQFVNNDEFAHGMGQETFRLFCESYRKDPQRTAKRFAALIAKGDRRAAAITRQLGNLAACSVIEQWTPWLDYLAEYKVSDFDFSYANEIVSIHGVNDCIVPFEQTMMLSEQHPHVKTVILPEAGHAPHLHDGETVRAWLNR
jgi:pimeloyl-[acyl-carrier protein] methyl ester esterase